MAHFSEIGFITAAAHFYNILVNPCNLVATPILVELEALKTYPSAVVVSLKELSCMRCSMPLVDGMNSQNIERKYSIRLVTKLNLV